MERLELSQIESLFGEKLDSTIFTWQSYCGTRGISVIRIFDRTEDDNGLFNDRFDCRGWCYSDSLIGGFSKPSGIAVMLTDKENNFEDVWCHINNAFQVTLFRLWELKKKL
jgi:hypothetical protein